jgi:hypothetical protein
MGSYAYTITLRYCAYQVFGFAMLVIFMFLQINASDAKQVHLTYNLSVKSIIGTETF